MRGGGSVDEEQARGGGEGGGCSRRRVCLQVVGRAMERTTGFARDRASGQAVVPSLNLCLVHPAAFGAPPPGAPPPQPLLPLRIPKASAMLMQLI